MTLPWWQRRPETPFMHIRKTYGKIAVDIGHVPELLLFPNKPYHQIIKNWLKTYPAHKGKPRQRLQAKPR